MIQYIFNWFENDLFESLNNFLIHILSTKNTKENIDFTQI